LGLIVKTDKNLGSAVIERDFYTRRVFEDHLLNANTYLFIEPQEAAGIIIILKMKVGQFLQSFSWHHPENEKELLSRSIQQHKKISPSPCELASFSNPSPTSYQKTRKNT
jgi:hypothetical protein